MRWRLVSHGLWDFIVVPNKPCEGKVPKVLGDQLLQRCAPTPVPTTAGAGIMPHTTRIAAIPAAVLLCLVLMLLAPSCRHSTRSTGFCNAARAAAVPPMSGGRLEMALFVFIPEQQVRGEVPCFVCDLRLLWPYLSLVAPCVAATAVV